MTNQNKLALELTDWGLRATAATKKRLEAIGEVQAQTFEDVKEGRVAAYQCGYQTGYHNAILDVRAIMSRNLTPTNKD